MNDADKPMNEDYAALRRSAKSPKDAQAFIAISTILGGERLVRGIDRIMDGLCPDCGEPDHDRCHKIEEPTAA